MIDSASLSLPLTDYVDTSRFTDRSSYPLQNLTNLIPDNSLSMDLTITNENGLHARPATRIALIAQQAKSNVWIIKDDKVVDSKSVISLLMLGCGKGSVVTVKIDDLSDIEVLNEIADVLKNSSDSF